MVVRDGRDFGMVVGLSLIGFNCSDWIGKPGMYFSSPMSSSVQKFLFPEKNKEYQL